MSVVDEFSPSVPLIEALLVGGVVALLAAIGAASLLPVDVLFSIGTVLIVAGMGIGVPTALVYHWWLYRGLQRIDALDKGWIWDPIGRHHLLIDGDRRRMLPWFYSAGLCFVVNCLGLVLWVVATVLVATGRG